MCSIHRHLREVESTLALPACLPAFVDSSSYVTSHSSHYEALFGAICRASVLICPRIQTQWLACQLWPMMSLFILDVYGSSFLEAHNPWGIKTGLVVTYVKRLMT